MIPRYEAKAFENEQIRDTAVNNSPSINNVDHTPETIIVDNALNQTVTIQLQASRDETKWFNVGSSFNVSASTITYQSTNDYFPYLRIQAQCSIAPTTGDLSVWIERLMP